jgi:uroporphyrinogen decarboxylase
MNKKDRVLVTFDHEEPDQVPITEMAIDVVHLERLVGTKLTAETSPQTQVTSDRQAEAGMVATTVRAYQKLGFELIPVELSGPDGWNPQKNPDGTMADEWGRVLSYDAKGRAWVATGSIFTAPEDFERFPFPDPNASGRTFAIEETKRRIGEDAVLGGWIKDPFAVAWEIFKVTDFVRWLYEKPNFIRQVIERVTDFNIAAIKRIVDARADVILSSGDYAEKKGPLVPVKFFKEVVFPNLRRQVEAAHKAGLKFIKHTDGNLNPILDDLANIVDGLQSLDPTASMDIGDVKRRYGDRLILIGNISVDNLCTRTREEIIRETKECLRTAAPGGGYVLSSSNSWYTDAKFENCLAMVDAGRKYGRYPISVRD